MGQTLEKITIINETFPSQKPTLALLDPTDNLTLIRQKLSEDYVINNILFLKKIPEDNNNENYKYAEIELNDEEHIQLNGIIDINNILYIKCNVDGVWNFL